LTACQLRSLLYRKKTDDRGRFGLRIAVPEVESSRNAHPRVFEMGCGRLRGGIYSHAHLRGHPYSRGYSQALI
jgi:hypothetical protein